MNDSYSLINLGGISKVGTALIEKISGAIGGMARPYQIKRIAEAEAEADRIHAVSQIEISELQHRAMTRFVAEETKKQINIETIIQKAIPEINDDAQPQNVEDDWISHFFDKCRLISDDEMQQLWAKVLAGEANSPGDFSKRTISLLSSLDKEDAKIFQNLCMYNWIINGSLYSLIYDEKDKIYTDRDINFPNLNHLDNIGLISYSGIMGYVENELPKRTTASYYGSPVTIEFKDPENNSLDIGKILFSQEGMQIASICDSNPEEDINNYVIEYWEKLGLKVE